MGSHRFIDADEVGVHLLLVQDPSISEVQVVALLFDHVFQGGHQDHRVFPCFHGAVILKLTLTTSFIMDDVSYPVFHTDRIAIVLMIMAA